MNKEENKHRLRDEYIKHKKEQFAKGLESAFKGNNLYVDGYLHSYKKDTRLIYYIYPKEIIT